MIRSALLSMLALVSASCYQSIVPEVGELSEFTAAACNGVDSEPERDVSYAEDIFPLFERSKEDGGCLDCHWSEGSDRSGFERTGLDLSTFRRMLIGSERFAGDELIVSGDPCSSVLYVKLTPGATEPRMPKDGPYWSRGEQQLLHDWIVEGAEDN